MRILILTQYFPPETGAPQNRLHELAIRLKKKGADVTVLTAMPNYPEMIIHKEYRGKFYTYEEADGLKIHRSSVFVSKSRSLIFRLINYFSFVCSSFFTGLFRIKRQDFILCESPPLFLGITAWLLKKIKRSKLVFNVSDLWPESAEKLGLVTNKFLLSTSKRLEEFLYKRSELVTGQTQGICHNISVRFPHKRIHWFPNGVDVEYYASESKRLNEIAAWREKNNFRKEDFILLYAGIIGYAQGLEVILNAADGLRKHYHIKFVLLGTGPEKKRLVEMKEKLKLTNVFFLDNVAKTEMPEILYSIDAAIIPLKKLELFKGAVPSKIFEALAMKKPILLGVEGEAKTIFIDKGKCGLAFTPEDDQMLSEKVAILAENEMLRRELGENGFAYVDQYFNRGLIVDDLWKVIEKL